MGIVLRAFDPDLERQVAIKLVLPSRSGGEESRARLVSEARALARVSHPNVVAVYEVGIHDGLVFLAMELVDGVDLHKWLKLEPRPWRAVVDAFEAAARGLAQIHAAGLVHRDVKPANILMDKRGHVRIGDFGLARASFEIDKPSLDGFEISGEDFATGGTAVTREGLVVGTPVYMAPEQHMGLDVGPPADQYALCIALYEALYGERPFPADPRRLFFAKQTPPVEPPPGTAVPRRLFAVIARGLCVDPTKRFASMDELCAALRADPWIARRRWLAIAGLALAGAGIAAWIGTRPAPCRDVEAQLAGAWDEPTRDAVAQAFERSDRPWAAQTWHWVGPRLDAYATEWVAMRRDACEATHVRREQSTDMFDRRIACLERRRRGLAAAAELLAAGDRDAVDHGVDLVAGLSPVAPCGDPVALAAAVPPPADPDVAARTDHLRGELARARALSAAGKYPDALELARIAREEAETLDYSPVLADALVTEGDALDRVGHLADARAALERGLWLAIAAGHDDAAAAAAVQLLWIAGERENALAEALRWGEFARATMQRAGIEEPRRHARVDQYIGVAYTNVARHDDALRAYESALARIADDPDAVRSVSSIRFNMGRLWYERGELARAREIIEPTLATLEGVLGRDHPIVAQNRGILAVILDDSGDGAAALAIHREVVASLRVAFDNQGATLAAAILNFGQALGRAGQREESIARRKEAREMFERAGDRAGAARSLASLGDAYRRAGAYDAAQSSLAEGLALLEGAVGREHPDLAPLLNALGDVQRQQRRYVEAMANFERSERIVRAAFGPWVQKRGVALGLMVLVLSDQERWAEAAKLSEQSVEVMRRAGDANANWLARALNDRAAALNGARAFGEALEAADEALKLAREHEMAELVPEIEPQRTAALAGLGLGK
jgi:tetratricopeptide (TPR) repeat protein